MKKCEVCGNECEDNEIYCPSCGARLSDEVKQVKKTKNKKNSFALVSFIVGLVAWVYGLSLSSSGFSILGFACSAVAIVFGIIALCKKLKGKSKVFAIIGIVGACIGLFELIIYPIVFEPILEEIYKMIDEFFEQNFSEALVLFR